ncbi:MAG: hypothetical protein ACLRMD_04070 [Ruminococcus sp.]
MQIAGMVFQTRSREAGGKNEQKRRV